MIVKFFAKSGKGGSSGVLDYMLGKDRDREDAKVIRGDADISAALIDQSLFERKYTSGCLSFEEEDIDQEIKDDLMETFEETLMAGLEKNQYNVLWIEHRDKGRLELNFVIPNVELTQGKRLQPFYSRADKPVVNTWKDMKNIEHGLSDPNDPIKKQMLTTPSDLPRGVKEAREQITSGLLHLAKEGEIKSRADVLKTLINAGFEVSRETNTSISIKNPTGGRNIRLKGYLYERDFRLGKELQREIEGASGTYRERSAERYKDAERQYQEGLERKRDYNQARHSGILPEAQKSDSRHLEDFAVGIDSCDRNLAYLHRLSSLHAEKQLRRDRGAKGSDPITEISGRELGDQYMRDRGGEIEAMRCLRSEIQGQDVGGRIQNYKNELERGLYEERQADNGGDQHTPKGARARNVSAQDGNEEITARNAEITNRNVEIAGNNEKNTRILDEIIRNIETIKRENSRDSDMDLLR